jgi:AcrR family transcriptional regulator
MLRTGYHHGGLSDLLIDLAIAQISASGMEKLSLRALAREAGVSTTAPYRHFSSRESLLAAIATRGFQKLTEKIDRSLATGATFEARFIAMGMTYIEHAMADPVSYHLMFGEMTGSGKHIELTSAADACFSRLFKILEINAPLERLGVSALELSATVWAGVHGVASLLITDLHQTRVGRAESQAGSALATLADHPERALRLLFSQWLQN